MDSAVCMMAYRPDGKHCVIGTKSGHVGVYDVTSGYEMIARLEGHSGTVRDFAYNRSGTVLASVAVEMSVRIWDVRNKYALKCVHYGPVDRITFAAEGLLIGGESTGNRKYLKF